LLFHDFFYFQLYNLYVRLIRVNKRHYCTYMHTSYMFVKCQFLITALHCTLSWTVIHKQTR